MTTTAVEWSRRQRRRGAHCKRKKGRLPPERMFTVGSGGGGQAREPCCCAYPPPHSNKPLHECCRSALLQNPGAPLPAYSSTHEPEAGGIRRHGPAGNNGASTKRVPGTDFLVGRASSAGGRVRSGLVGPTGGGPKQEDMAPRTLRPFPVSAERFSRRDHTCCWRTLVPIRSLSDCWIVNSVHQRLL